VGKDQKMMGLRGTPHLELFFDNVQLEDAALLGEVGQGFKLAMGALNVVRLAQVGARAVGKASHVCEMMVAYAKDRRQFGQRIGDFQLVQQMLADSQAELLAGWSLVRSVAAAYDQKDPAARDGQISMQASCAKMFTTEMVGRVADRGVQIHGGAGYINEYKVERFYRDVRLLRLYEGTTQIQQLVVGRHLMREA